MRLQSLLVCCALTFQGFPRHLSDGYVDSSGTQPHKNYELEVCIAQVLAFICNPERLTPYLFSLGSRGGGPCPKAHNGDNADKCPVEE